MVDISYVDVISNDMRDTFPNIK